MLPIAAVSSAAESTRPGTIDLCLAGDVMIGRGVDQLLPHPSEPELFEDYVKDARDYVLLAERASGPIPHPVAFDWIWGEALDVMLRAKLRIINLETSITQSDAAWPAKGIHYRMHPGNVPCLLAARIDVCALANNHVLDWGRRGLVETIATLRAAGIRTAGAGGTAAEAAQIAVAPIAGGGRVLVAGLAERSSGVPVEWAAEADLPGVTLLEELDAREADLVVERIDRVRRGGDVVVASIHWGSNWGYEVEPEHVRFARALVDRGVDVVHGHSSHHPRPIEIYRGKPILYGCGDLINDYEGIRGHEGYRADRALLYSLRFAGRELVELRATPLRLRRMRLERATEADALWLGEVLTEASHPFGTRVVLEDGTLRASA